MAIVVDTQLRIVWLSRVNSALQVGAKQLHCSPLPYDLEV